MTTAAHPVHAPTRAAGATPARRPAAAEPDVESNRRRLRDLAAQGRSGVNLADLSPAEIDARLFGV